MSRLSELYQELKDKKYVDSKGKPLNTDTSFVQLILLVESAYMHGLINGAKRFAHLRKGKHFLGRFDFPLEDFIKECEEKFGFSYKNSYENGEKVEILDKNKSITTENAG